MPIIPEEPLKGLPKNFGKMKDEVVDAARGDWKHHMVDEAKKKAIYSSKDYDDFKQRVAGCTLKPISRKEFNAPPKFAFNKSGLSGASNSKRGGYAGNETTGNLPVGKTLPKNSGQFDKEWRRCANLAEKLDLLLRIAAAESVVEVFGKGLDPELFIKILNVLDDDEAKKEAPEGFGQSFTRKFAESCRDPVLNAVAFFSADEKALFARILLGQSSVEEVSENDSELLKSIGLEPSMAK